MAALPSPSQVAGSHAGLYEVYFASVERQGTVPAVEAAKFLKKSELPDSLLSTIWDLSDPNAKGFLTKSGFFTALKLVSLAQLGHEVSIANLMMDVPPPKLVGMAPPRPPSQPTINSVPAAVNDWKMTPAERLKYETLFNSLHPLNGVIPGSKVKGLLSDSKLPIRTLGKIWDLADMDKDGSLDRHEFTVAMHLVYKALENYTIPNSLPPELLPPEKLNNSVPAMVPQATPIAPVVTQTPMVNGGSTWVVSREEKAKYDNLFFLTDVDKDGFVSGNEIKDVFLKSGIPQSVLADIWGLCDMKQSGKLNSEQFALAMWLINKKLKGIDPPSSLSPDMIPPSMRQTPSESVVPSNPELDMISQDIEELVKERYNLEREIMMKESEIKIKSGEAVSLQGELDTLAATLKQLDNQKGEAGRRLNDLKNQVEKLKKDAEEQEVLVKQQEEELTSKKKELENLKAEEIRLSNLQTDLNSKLDSLSAQLQKSQLTISQAKTKMTDIIEFQKQLKEAIDVLEKALETSDISVPNRYLELEPDFRYPAYTRLINPSETEEIKPVSQTTASLTNGTRTDSFSESAFKDDPFTSNNSFQATFPDQPSKMSFGNDPFSSFGSSVMSTGTKNDPFDPFGGSTAPHSTVKNTEDTNQDAFGCEPFAAPALPPKNKQPPPRPAPPRPSAPPAHITATPGNDSFADFSNFNNKFTMIIQDNNNSDLTLDFKEDPFKDYRYEVTGDPFENDNLFDIAKCDNFAFTKNDPFAPSKDQKNPLNGKFKSCEELLNDNQIANNANVDSHSNLVKETKCDSLPSLLT
ncbi:epidermal growth factor receptor substrate 15-like 1 [Cimex lectularius]|uniref:Epidermal growth factor receptor substrate 15-like 1 n=1 Tax=Cimex lectularius TaxID=79782 RepID=A0A8I6TEC3_CIMLE|nr:epidermal growth factor receptor substrate 15-like 1 [Cimex lectularius]